MINSFDHIHIYATDPEQTMAFYERHFDAERLGRLPAGEGGFNHVLLLGGQYLVVAAFPAAVEPDEAPGDGQHGTRGRYGVAHIGINVTGIDGLVADLQAAGVRVHGAPKGAGLLRYVYCDAPDGVTIELTEYVLPRKLAPAARILNGFKKGVHVARKAIARRLLAAV